MERIDELNIKGLKVIQNTDYFLFGVDSVILANTVKTKKNDLVLDLCTGTAVIPIIIDAKNSCNKLIGVELQDEMYKLALKNIKLNKLEDRIDIMHGDVKDIKGIRKTLLDKYNTDSVSVITCNPPYKQVGTGINIELSVKDIARNEVMCTLEDIFKTSQALLISRGRLYMVHKPERIADLICVGRKYNMELKSMRLMQPDIEKKPSLVLLEYVKDGGNECNIKNVLLQYEADGKPSKEIIEMYKEE